MAGFTGRATEAVDGAIKAAGTAVTLVIGLVGIMTLWLGLMRLAERAGLVSTLATILRPVLIRLFPDVPPAHPAMGSMVLNIAANMLGLNNAATPLGLRAMRDLESLNPRPGTATNAMCTFLAINTGSVQLLPISAIAILAAAGSVHPTAIVGTTLITTLCSSAAGLVVVKWLERWPCFQFSREDEPTQPKPPKSTDDAAVAIAATVPGVPTSKANNPADPDAANPATTDTHAATSPPLPWIRGSKILLWIFALLFIWFGYRLTGSSDMPEAPGWIRCINAISTLAIPFLLAFFPLYAALRRIPVYEEFIVGAREGFNTAVGIIPYLVAMLVAIGFFRGAGGIELLTRVMGPVLEAVHFPVELLPMALLRPLTGSGTYAALADLVQAHGPDSLVSRMGGTVFGSTETTFYVIAVYFGSVGIRRTRHAIWAGLTADLVGVIAAVIFCRLFFGNLS